MQLLESGLGNERALASTYWRSWSGIVLESIYLAHSPVMSYPFQTFCSLWCGKVRCECFLVCSKSKCQNKDFSQHPQSTPSLKMWTLWGSNCNSSFACGFYGSSWLFLQERTRDSMQKRILKGSEPTLMRQHEDILKSYCVCFSFHRDTHRDKLSK